MTFPRNIFGLPSAEHVSAPCTHEDEDGERDCAGTIAVTLQHERRSRDYPGGTFVDEVDASCSEGHRVDHDMHERASRYALDHA